MGEKKRKHHEHFFIPPVTTVHGRPNKDLTKKLRHETIPITPSTTVSCRYITVRHVDFFARPYGVVNDDDDDDDDRPNRCILRYDVACVGVYDVTESP